MDSYLRIFCLFSTYLDTLFCNLALLHAFCSGLDSYLRLCGPSTYLVSARRRPTTWLKIGSPWVAAGLQAIGQLALSDRDKAKFFGDCQHPPSTQFADQFEAACVISDPNFLIMRTTIAYALPLIACLVLTGLQMKRLRRLHQEPQQTLKSLLLVRKQTSSKATTKKSMTSHLSKRQSDKTIGNFLQPPAKTTSASINSVAITGSGEVLRTRRHNPAYAMLVCSESTFGSRSTDTYGLRRDITNETLVAHTSTITETQLSRSNTIDTFDNVPSPGVALVQLADVEGSTEADPLSMSTSVHECPRHGKVTLPGNQVYTVERSDPINPYAALTPNLAEKRQVTLAVLSGDEYRIVNSQVPFAAMVTPPSLSHSKLARQAEAVFPPHHICQSAGTLPSCGKPHGGPRVYESSCLQSKQAMAKSRRQIPAQTTGRNPDFVSDGEYSTWLQAYRGEQMAVAISMVSCIVAVGVWSPLILSSLAYGLCQLPEQPKIRQTIYYIPGLNPQSLRSTLSSQCFIQITVPRLADFRWWAYASTGLLLPLVLLLMDTELRKSCWRSLGLVTRRPRGKSSQLTDRWPDLEMMATAWPEQESSQAKWPATGAPFVDVDEKAENVGEKEEDESSHWVPVSRSENFIMPRSVSLLLTRQDTK
ncbi:unnamed protein product [Schistocephalus solidus]|nr:unnamed protein product [Schistocephalus solidus]